MRKTTFGLLFLILAFMSASESYGQKKLLSAKGYFCGQSETLAVHIHLKIGNFIKVFSTSPDGGERTRGFSGPYFKLPIGTELIIKYKKASDGNWIYEAIATGRRNRSVKRCVDE